MERSSSTRPRRGDELELRVDSLAFGGAGVARLEGYVVFVRDAVPGDVVRVRIEDSKRAYAQGRAVAIITPGPDRIPPRRRPSGRALAGASI